LSVADREIAASILESCRHGDRDAFRALYEAYKDKVYSICLYFFHGDTAEAADVTHEVFLKVFAGIAGFQGEAGFSTWLYRLTQNACLDDARRRAARARTAESARGSFTIPLPTQPPTQEADLTRAEAAQTVQQAVSSLPPKFRLPILLRYFEGFSYEEMSTTLNCSMGTVASRLNRGHKMLAKLLSAGGRHV
jgi:RNA polymerase sigma-70 factor (ECF subfamily)